MILTDLLGEFLTFLKMKSKRKQESEISQLILITQPFTTLHYLPTYLGR